MRRWFAIRHLVTGGKFVRLGANTEEIILEGMGKEDLSLGEDDWFNSEQANELIVAPLGRKIDEEAHKIEELIAGFQLELYANLDQTKREILRRIGEVETSVEMVAREMARKRSGESLKGDDRDSL